LHTFIEKCRKPLFALTGAAEPSPFPAAAERLFGFDSLVGDMLARDRFTDPDDDRFGPAAVDFDVEAIIRPG